jgi:hypothetical protein
MILPCTDSLIPSWWRDRPDETQQPAKRRKRSENRRFKMKCYSSFFPFHYNNETGEHKSLRNISKNNVRLLSEPIPEQRC